jgi:hypothetical protein
VLCLIKNGANQPGLVPGDCGNESVGAGSLCRNGSTNNNSREPIGESDNMRSKPESDSHQRKRTCYIYLQISSGDGEIIASVLVLK